MASRHEKALKASLSFLKGFMDHLYVILHCINSEVVRKASYTELHSHKDFLHTCSSSRGFKLVD